MTPGRFLYLLRRDIHRGWDATHHHYKTLPRIAKWEWPFWSEAMQEMPVHLLTGKKDYLLSAWMLASWFHFSEYAWPVVVHDDGTLPPEGVELLTRLFKNVRIISRREADAAMERRLKEYPFCYEYRDMHPLALKIFDVPHFATAQRFLIFDSDLLFFSHPREIMDWVSGGKPDIWFNEDVAETSLVSAEEAREELGVSLWERVNSGLCCAYRPAFDLDFCDRALAQTSILRGHVWRVEQTLFALCASAHRHGGLLPRRYEVSLGRTASPEAVARHYVGAVRDRFYGEGLKRLAPVLLAQEE